MAFYSYIFSANYPRYFDNLKKVAKKENKIAGILGIIISISIIIGLIGVIARLIDIVLGIFILIHSIKYLKEN